MIVLSPAQFDFLKQTLSSEVFAILDLSQIDFVENGEEILDGIELLNLIETLKTHYAATNTIPILFSSLDEPLMSLPSCLLEELVPTIDLTQSNDEFLHRESTNQAQPKIGSTRHPNHFIMEQTSLETLLSNNTLNNIEPPAQEKSEINSGRHLDYFTMEQILLTNDSPNHIEPTTQAQPPLGSALHPNHLIMEQTLLEISLINDSLNIEPIVQAHHETSSALPLHPDHFIMEQTLLENLLKQVPPSSPHDKKRMYKESSAAGEDDQQKKMKSTKDIMGSLLSTMGNKLDDANAHIQQSHLMNSQIDSPKNTEKQQLDQSLFDNVSLQTPSSPFFTRKNLIPFTSLPEDSYIRSIHSPFFLD